MPPVVLPQVMEHFQENTDLTVCTTLENGALQRH